MTVPEIQKWTFFNGESRTFYQFLPLFRGESRKKQCENTPLLLPFQGHFSILYPILREVKDKILRYFANSYKPSEGPRGDTLLFFSTDILV